MTAPLGIGRWKHGVTLVPSAPLSSPRPAREHRFLMASATSQKSRSLFSTARLSLGCGSSAAMRTAATGTGAGANLPSASQSRCRRTRTSGAASSRRDADTLLKGVSVEDSDRDPHVTGDHLSRNMCRAKLARLHDVIRNPGSRGSRAFERGTTGGDRTSVRGVFLVRAVCSIRVRAAAAGCFTILLLVGETLGCAT